MNWYGNELPERELRDLSSASSVGVSESPGRQFMDVGRIEFKNGTSLDSGKTMYFQNFNTYCVAPITIGSGRLSTYDFWSVGINCCEDGTFRCGEYNNPNARSGLRLVREDQRDFYLLAVRQAEAAYNLRTDTPLFFFWMQEPAAGVDTYQTVSEKHFG